ncbi:MAG: preprotein translocase subunit YajC [Nitriliruptoraceae bacterium]
MQDLGSLLLPLVFLVILYLLLIRPQQKRRKEHQQMVQSVSVGDDIVTIGGLHGRIIGLTDDAMDIAVDADEDVVMRYERSSLGRIVRDEDEPDAS